MNFATLRAHSAQNLGTGTDLKQIEALEELWDLRLPESYRNFLLEIGYAEIFGDEIYSIYEVPDSVACLGLHWMNKDNPHLQQGYIEFYSNDLDGTFFISAHSGEIYLNGITNLYAASFEAFLAKLVGS